MTTLVTVGVVALIILFALLGALRDLPRGILVLTGVFFGAALVAVWATPLAELLGSSLGNSDLGLLQRFASVVIFSASTLILGVGSGLLMPIITGSTAALRLVGGLLGAFTGVVAGGFLLNYAAAGNPTFVASLRASPAGALLFDQFALLLGLGAALIGLAVAGALAMRLLSRPEPETPAVEAPPSAQQRTTDQAIADRIKQKL
ncbi:MAG: hypothetical protein H7Z42_04900 [Roseiflexaceae bacterium]|nr:hypothetical protein [Roseiflexaceae bacterium]